MSYDYEKLLSRAKDKLPSEVAAHERFVIPEATVLVEGKTTVLRNFNEIVSVIRRKDTDVLQYLLKELGTAGTLEGKRVVFKGRVTEKQVNDKVKSYVNTYVICAECARPDTQLVKEGRILILECEACGARRPVKVRKSSRLSETPVAAIQEGKVYEVMIQDVGRKGDGIAKVDKYVIYVPGTAKGVVCKVMIEKVTGTVAFAHVSRE